MTNASIFDTQVVPGIYTNSNRGIQVAMYVGEAGVGAGTSLRSLVQFSVTNISSDMIITSATLRLGVSTGQTGPGGLLSADFYRLLVPWVEGDGDAISPFTNNGTTGATWYKRDKAGSLPDWTAPGANGSGTDRATSASFTLGAGDAVSITGGQRLSKDVTADVQAWVNGSAANFGWVAFATDLTAGRYTGYATKEFAGANFAELRPSLIISYIPEPSALTLAGLAGLLAWCRQQRR